MAAHPRVVRSGPQTLATIASELNHPNVESIDRIVRRQKNVFTKVPSSDGIYLWPWSSGGLREHDNAVSAAPRYHNRSVGMSARTARS
jgi:hypothetical protein